MKNRLGMVLTCPFCHSHDVVDREPMLHTTTSGTQTKPRFHRPRHPFYCNGCQRVLRRVYAKKPETDAPVTEPTL